MLVFFLLLCRLCRSGDIVNGVHRALPVVLTSLRRMCERTPSASFDMLYCMVYNLPFLCLFLPCHHLNRQLRTLCTPLGSNLTLSEPA